MILECILCACNVCYICGSTTEYGYASRSSLTGSWLEVSLPVYLVDRHRSGTMEPRMNEEGGCDDCHTWAHETSPRAVRSLTDRHRCSWQPISAILIWPLARREILKGERLEEGQEKIAGHHGEPESVCRSADRIKTPWIIHRRDRARGPTTGSLPACLRCALSALLPFSLEATRRNGDSKFTRCIFDDYVYSG